MCVCMQCIRLDLPRIDAAFSKQPQPCLLGNVWFLADDVTNQAHNQVVSCDPKDLRKLFATRWNAQPPETRMLDSESDSDF